MPTRYKSYGTNYKTAMVLDIYLTPSHLAKFHNFNGNGYITANQLKVYLINRQKFPFPRQFSCAYPSTSLRYHVVLYRLLFQVPIVGLVQIDHFGLQPP